MGMGLDRAVRAVHDSNMSMLCGTREEAEARARTYRDHGPKGCPPPPIAVRRADAAGRRWVVFDERTGEVLRGPSWRAGGGV